jgi:fumarylacetoacetate (FAA) hydrolase
MKLATYKDGSRDGQLVVVSRDLSHAHYASHIANRLQQVMDDWNFLSPQLQDLYTSLNNGRARHAFAFDPQQCMAPLPRAYQFVDSVAYPCQTALTRTALGADTPDGAAATPAAPAMAQASSDAFWGPRDAIACASEDFGVDFGAGMAVVTGDIPMGCPADRALDGIRLVMLTHTLSLRHLMANDQDDGLGSVQSRLSAACSPVAVTPDELGDAWSRGRIQLPLVTSWNGRKVGLCDAGADMAFHFGQLIAYAAKTRLLRAGSLIGTGAVANLGVTKGGGAKAHTDWPKGYHSIAHKRAMETLQDGKPSTGYLKYGDTVRSEMKDAAGHSLFGAIEHELVSVQEGVAAKP